VSRSAQTSDSAPLRAFTAQLPAPETYAGSLSDAAKIFVEEVREELERDTWAGEGGIELTLRFSEAVDTLVRFVVDATTIRFSKRYARAHQRCGVIAQGGYGRREMNPWSDVDLLIVYPGRISPYVETISERLIQTLFDANLQAGWAVRTMRDCLEQAERDLTIKTSMLDGRYVAGSRALGSEFTEVVQDRLIQKDALGFINQKMDEYLTRHAAQGGSVFLLEPNIKEGKGGLRDLHTLVWIARAKCGVLSLTELAENDLASVSEQRELVRAHEFLLRIRNALHFLTRVKQDKLSFEAQEQISSRFGYEKTADHTAVDVFMRDYYSHAAIVARTAADILTRLTAPPEPTGLLQKLGSRKVRPGVTISGGHLVAEESLFVDDPVELLRIFQDAQRNALTLSAATQQIVRKNAKRLTLKVARSAEAVDVFMAVLKSTDGVYRTLAEMHRLGVLGRLIPEFGRLFCMVQHDFYHVYTVDEHSLIGIHELESVRAGDYADASPVLTHVMRACDRPDLLFLAMMFHDLGKGYGGDHDERGALMVRDIGKRLRLHLDDRRSLEFLVRNHLMMSMLAQTRDIEDDELVASFVRDVGTVQNLRNLYLLTFADMKAVGPTIWNGWRDHLLGELYLRAVDVFETGAVSEANRQARVRRVRNRLIAATAGDDERVRLEGFLEQMPESYLLHTTDERIVDHWRLYESLGAGLFRAGVAHYPSRGFSELTVCTYDSEGLFVRLCGVLSARNLGIVSAKIVTLTQERIAIDTFRVDHANEDVNVLDPEVWAELRNDIERVLADELDVAEMVDTSERARPVPASVRRARKRARTNVGIDNVVSRKFTVIEVYAADRRGLLFRVANAIYESGLKIHIAMINTHVNQVLDVFYVTDTDGKKIRSDADQARVCEAIRRQIVEDDGSPTVQPSES